MVFVFPSCQSTFSANQAVDAYTAFVERGAKSYHTLSHQPPGLVARVVGIVVIQAGVVWDERMVGQKRVKGDGRNQVKAFLIFGNRNRYWTGIGIRARVVREARCHLGTSTPIPADLK